MPPVDRFRREKIVHHPVFVVLATLLAVISPGADFAVVTRTAIAHGRFAAWAVSLGIGAASFGHVAYAVFGMAAICRVFPHAMNYLRLFGALYLGWLGVGMLRSLPVERHDARTLTVVGAFVSGFITNLFNPKTAVFVISLAAFALGAHPSGKAVIAFGAIISLCHTGWFALCAQGLSRKDVLDWVRRREVAVRRGIGVALLTIGLSLLVV